MKTIAKKILFTLFFFYAHILINAQTNKELTVSPLQNKWSTERVLSIPESVIYCKTMDLLFVSNICGNPSEKDGKGFISKLAIDGSILQLKWINGLNAPKGMGIFEGKLYVADIDELVEIEISTGKIIKKYPAKKAKFLNDVVVDKNGSVYVSDTQVNLIYCLKNNKFDIWLSVGNLFNPNGLLCDNNELLVGCNNYVLSIDTETKHVRTFITETGSIDGLVKISDTQFVISDWVGNIYLINKSEPKIKLLTTEADNINAADIEYIKEKKLLIVPTFSDNRIMAYELGL
jgi:hypothetical protein